MDFCRKEERARWQSLGSISRFGWCGSAAAGGVLADRYGYAFTFYITAAVQLSGSLVLVPLLALVPRKEAAAAAAAAAVGALEARGVGGGQQQRTLTQPLAPEPSHTTDNAATAAPADAESVRTGAMRVHLLSGRP